MRIFIIWAIESAVIALVLYVIGRLVLPEVGLDAVSYGHVLGACGLWYGFNALRVGIVAGIVAGMARR